MMQMGMDGIFVGSGIFKSSDPKTMADAIVMATAHYDNNAKVAEAMAMMEGVPMKGDELETLEIRLVGTQRLVSQLGGSSNPSPSVTRRS